jgi:hypothetical protein
MDVEPDRLALRTCGSWGGRAVLKHMFRAKQIGGHFVRALATAEGTLAAPQSHNSGGRPVLAIGDVTGDRRPDVLVGGGFSAGGYSLLENRCLP